MAFLFYCDGCGKPLEEPGALLFSPPHINETGRHSTVKLHIGICCWEKVYWHLMSLKEK